MAKLKFGAWIPTYAWSGKKTDPRNMRRIRESIVKCEKHGIDVWVIDHLLSAPGLYGNAWLEPLTSLAYAAALTSKVDIATGILVLPVRHPVLLAKEISTLCHLSNNRYVFGVGPGWYAREYEVTGSRIQERGRRTDEARKVEVGHVGYGDRDSHPSLELTMDVGDRAPAEVRPTGIHVAIQVSDLARLCGMLENESVAFIQALKAGGRDGRRLTAWIRDPDGHAIELIEIRPA